MNVLNMLTVMSEKSFMDNQLFPFPFPIHLTFCCIALFFFLFQFYRKRKIYQAIMCIAVPLTLLIWTSTHKTPFFIVGVCEVILLTVAYVSAVIDRKKEKQTEETAKKNNSVEDSVDTSEKETESSVNAADEESK